jgi:hypothetical protein
MMKIDNIIDDVVLLALNNHEPLAELGLTQKALYAKIVGYDEYGIWIEYPKFKIPKITDKKTGKPKFQTVNGSLLIPWGFIVSIVHFPGVKGFDLPDPFETHIGFDVEK